MTAAVVHRAAGGAERGAGRRGASSARVGGRIARLPDGARAAVEQRPALVVDVAARRTELRAGLRRRDARHRGGIARLGGAAPAAVERLSAAVRVDAASGAERRAGEARRPGVDPRVHRGARVVAAAAGVGGAGARVLGGAGFRTGPRVVAATGVARLGSVAAGGVGTRRRVAAGARRRISTGARVGARAIGRDRPVACAAVRGFTPVRRDGTVLLRAHAAPDGRLRTGPASHLEPRGQRRERHRERDRQGARARTSALHRRRPFRDRLTPAFPNVPRTGLARQLRYTPCVLVVCARVRVCAFARLRVCVSARRAGPRRPCDRDRPDPRPP